MNLLKSVAKLTCYPPVIALLSVELYYLFKSSTSEGDLNE